MRVYISGPIKGFEETYRERFAAAAELLRSLGHTTVNPVDVGDAIPGEPSYEDFMKYDLLALIPCDAIYMLRGWERSTGARCEHHVAALCGIEAMYE